MIRADRDIAALYQRTYHAVFGRCRALVGNDADARDLTQEVYMSLLENPTAFRGAAGEITYLFAIATNRSINRLRSRLRRSDEWEHAVSAFLDTVRPSQDHAARLEAKQILVEVLSRTDETTALIVLYHFGDGIPQVEVAELVGLSRVAVNQRLQAFRRKLPAEVG